MHYFQNKSLAFVPLSVRSSTDDLDSSEKLSQLNRTAKTNDDIEYFFSTKSKESESKGKLETIFEGFLRNKNVTNLLNRRENKQIEIFCG
jgi:hypothetical protein